MNRKIYTIPSGLPFADMLALALLEETKGNQEKLSQYRVLMPTRRACRTLQNAFLKKTEGKPLILPSLQPLGDVDEDELSFMDAASLPPEIDLDIPPAISPLQRKILLARHIMALDDFVSNTESALSLADQLGRLMDRIYTENLTMAALPGLVDEEELAKHWQITISFLEILSRSWPALLEKFGAIDAADRRNRLMLKLAAYWTEQPPDFPVIAAGTTGSIPATAAILKAISKMPKGRIILPGLDVGMDEKSWEAMDDTHPQMTMKILLQTLDAARRDVEIFNVKTNDSLHMQSKIKAKQALSSEMMRPAQTCDKWRDLPERMDTGMLKSLSDALDDVRFLSADTTEHEAKLIAAIMRDMIEAQFQTAALVTPDRELARRVAAECRRWDIIVDDSSGVPFPDTACGNFMNICAIFLSKDYDPALLLSLLKHDYALSCRALRTLIDRAEIHIFRADTPPKSPAELIDLMAKSSDFLPLHNILEKMMHAKVAFGDIDAKKAQNPFLTQLDLYLEFAQMLCPPDRLWADEDGNAGAQAFSNLREYAEFMPPINAADFSDILLAILKKENVRPAHGAHPRLFILGHIEARLIQADVVIMGGLNEGTWPPAPKADPWMSRPMQKKFGLPSPERSVGLSAHDFVQAFCCERVFMTRSLRKDGAPTAPARWLLRLTTVLSALGLKDKLPLQEEDLYHHYVHKIINVSAPPAPYARPAPKPPVELRPHSLYVTAIEKWMRDPYHIFVRYILGLKPANDLLGRSDVALKGTVLHEIFDEFIRRHPKTLPDNAAEILNNMAQGIMEKTLGKPEEAPSLWGFWWPRFESAAKWFLDHERQWRQKATFGVSEAKGEAVLQIGGGIPDFNLRAKADRIDYMGGTALAIIDYKTGSPPSQKDLINGFSPQLPLEGVIAKKGHFDGLQNKDKEIDYLGFWLLSGKSSAAGEEKPVKGVVETIVQDAEKGLTNLVRVFYDETVPYYSLPRSDKAPPEKWQDYAHLARVQEWAALDGDDAFGEAS